MLKDLTIIDYAKRLREFNSTSKYRAEMRFLFSMLEASARDSIIDYGCGLGTAVNYLRSRGLNVRGFDVRRWWDNEKDPPPDWWIDGVAHCDAVYFMHSLAHIEDPGKLLKMIHALLRPAGRVVVITPNLKWLNLLPPHKDYKPDPTVKGHFTPAALEQLFISSGFNIKGQGQFGSRRSGCHERLFLIANK